MAKKLVINQNLVNDTSVKEVMAVCPFSGLEYKDGKLEFTAGCKTCGLCVRKGPKGLVTEVVEEDNRPKLDKSKWHGVAVYMEIDVDGIHPVVFELLGKARELASVINDEVYAILVCGKDKEKEYSDLALEYGADKVYVYSSDELKDFNMDRYSRCIEDFIEKVHPNTVLYGGTALGRSLAPKVAQHFRTGLTADCTKLGMKENSDLIQVRPAFGGNVMAQIISPNTRPQMATVRYKIFKMPEKQAPHGTVIKMNPEKLDMTSLIKTLDIKVKPKVVDISNADIIVACGRAFKSAEDMKMAEELADLLDGVVAVTRPMVEAGFRDAKFQIGLSGRTVAPKLIICLGISGAVQFTAGMNGSELIIAINKDPNASIFGVSHYGIVGDIYQIVPKLIENIKNNRSLI